MTAAATQRPGAARHADTKGGNKISRQSSLALKFRHLSMKILIDVSNLTAHCIGEVFTNQLTSSQFSSGSDHA